MGKQSPVDAVFERWNSYSGRIANKRGRPVLWIGHRRRPDGSLSPEIMAAVNSVLANYSVEEINGAITNYAEVLLSPDYFWSCVWSLPEFLTRKQGREKDSPKQFWRFLPDNFNLESYRLFDQPKQSSELNFDGSTEDEITAAFAEG